MLGEGVALGALAGERRNRRHFGDRRLRRQFVFRSAGFQFLERKRQLFDQTRRAFRSLPIDLALQFRDPKLLLRDQRHVFGRLGLGSRQRRPQGGDFLGECIITGVHETK